ncbi:hypothetical protein HPP92_003898 [Vanilla planifolia]|uniref:Uncharacterized protein n=1 Tax=Vanilla planifolia TaxID=51239 RepID=A0A835S4I8_VANPL|nr:hypothetical protein HPP92_003898 [Vanilla planifolia]
MASPTLGCLYVYTPWIAPTMSASLLYDNKAGKMDASAPPKLCPVMMRTSPKYFEGFGDGCEEFLGEKNESGDDVRAEAVFARVGLHETVAGKTTSEKEEAQYVKPSNLLRPDDEIIPVTT